MYFDKMQDIIVFYTYLLLYSRYSHRFFYNQHEGIAFYTPNCYNIIKLYTHKLHIIIESYHEEAEYWKERKRF